MNVLGYHVTTKEMVKALLLNQVAQLSVTIMEVRCSAEDS